MFTRCRTGSLPCSAQIVLHGGSVDFATLGEEVWGDDSTRREHHTSLVVFTQAEACGLAASLQRKRQGPEGVDFQFRPTPRRAADCEVS